MAQLFNDFPHVRALLKYEINLDVLGLDGLLGWFLHLVGAGSGVDVVEQGVLH